MEFIAPSSISKLTWNGKDVAISASDRGSFVGTISAIQPSISLPSLEDLEWKAANRSDWVLLIVYAPTDMIIPSLPELEVDFDDSEFVLADLTETNVGDMGLYRLNPPLTEPVYESATLIWRICAKLATVWVSLFVCEGEIPR